jgi:hypothetical protein
VNEIIVQSQDLVQELWDERRAWSITADRLKSQLTFWRTIVSVLTASGALLQTLAATVEISAVRIAAGTLGTIALALVPFLVRNFLTMEQTRGWLRARSVSEGMKSEIYAYRASAEPYDFPGAADLLRKKVREIRDSAKGLELERAKIRAPSTPAPATLDPNGYLSTRVTQQIEEYYRPKARRNAILAERLHWLEIGLAGLAAILSAVATFLGDPTSAKVGPWVAVLTTIGGNIAAHAAASRYDFQATTFFATARQLEDLTQDWRASGESAPSKTWSEFVRSCEETISAENRGWMAKLDEKA